jgi:hypothetical protein
MLHEVLGQIENFASSAVHSAEALAAGGVLTGDGTTKKGYAVSLVQKLADAFLSLHQLGFLKPSVDPLIDGIVEAALVEAEHLLRGLGGFGTVVADLVKKAE